MPDKSYSREDPLGDIHHYDENGRETGVSRRGVLGGYTDYDAEGRRTGRTEDLALGGLVHYDKKGHVTGRSDEGIFGDYTERDAGGRVTGYGRRSVLDADPGRLEKSGSVYRRSADPPPLFDADLPAGDAPDTAERAAPAAKGNGRAAARPVRSAAVLAVLILFVLPGFLRMFVFTLSGEETLWYIERVAGEVRDAARSLEEYGPLIDASAAAETELRSAGSAFRARRLRLEQWMRLTDGAVPAIRYRSAWRAARSAAGTVAELSRVLSGWDADGALSPEEAARVSAEARELLPGAEKAVERLERELARIEMKNAGP